MSKTSLMAIFPSCAEDELSCMVGAVSSLLLLSLLPTSVARLPLLDIIIPDVLEDMLRFGQLSCWSWEDVLPRLSNVQLLKVVIDDVLEKAPDVVDLGGVAVPLARNVIPRSESSSITIDARGEQDEDGGKESPYEESSPDRDETLLGLDV